MATADQGKTGGYSGAGYAAAGYPEGQGPDRLPDFRYCPAAAFLCGSDRTGIHTPETGRRDCRCPGKRGTAGKKAGGKAGGL